MSKDNRRIIVVDDEKDIVQAYLDFLAPTGSRTPKRSSRSAATVEAPEAADASFEIFQANSGEQALQVIQAQIAKGEPVAAGFFDVKMDPGIDGIQTIREIWKLDPGLHCVIVTAYHDRSVQDIDTLFGPRFKDQWDYLNKPFTSGEIIQKARQMIAAWNRKRGLEDALAQLKATQEQLVKSERLAAIGQVARGIGHEFGNILQRIVGKADLSLNLSEVNDIRANLEIIIQAAERAGVIVRNLQSFSKTESARMSVDARKILGDAVALVNHEFKKANVQLSDKRGEAPSVKANAIELQQVFLNLIINAIHAMPNGGTLEIGAETAQLNGTPAARYWISDTGTGIPADVLPKIFEYAFTTKGEKGSGLGLSISKGIVDGHGGTIAVTSEPGKGTRFDITIPAGGS